MKVYLGADHRGFKSKEHIKLWLEKHNYPHEDMGAYTHDTSDDYTLYAEKVASMVRNNAGAKGVLLCGSGVGVDVVANKFDGIRASLGKSVKQVQAGRKDDDMNVLVVAADFTTDKETTDLVKTFLDTNFDGLSRHKRRLEEIERIEENN